MTWAPTRAVPRVASLLSVATVSQVGWLCGGVDVTAVLPDQGCYEESNRLTGRDALGLAASLLSIGLGFLWHTQPIFFAIAVVLQAG